MAKPFRFTLVGKFSQGCPTMERSRKIFNKLDLKGNFSSGHLDQKHVLIRVHHEGDFNILWLKETRFLNGYPMRIFCWTSNFRADEESSIVPIWVSLPNLPIYMFKNIVSSPLVASLKNLLP